MILMNLHPNHLGEAIMVRGSDQIEKIPLNNAVYFGASSMTTHLNTSSIITCNIIPLIFFSF